MLFYRVTHDAELVGYRGTLATAHKLAKCTRPYSLGYIEVVDLDTSKASIEVLLANIYESNKPGKIAHDLFGLPIRSFTLSPRGGLRPSKET